MKLVLLAFILFTPVFANTVEFDCSNQDVCFQSTQKKKEKYSEPIKYEQPKQEASRLLSDVLNTLGLEVIKKSDNIISASKKSTFLKVVTRIDFSLEEENTIHFKVSSDSPKLDWGEANTLLEQVKFRFYQNNM